MSQAKVTISRPHRNHAPHDFILIEIRPTGYGGSRIEIEMTPEAFALAVTGLGQQPAIFKQNP